MFTGYLDNVPTRKIPILLLIDSDRTPRIRHTTRAGNALYAYACTHAGPDLGGELNGLVAPVIP